MRKYNSERGSNLLRFIDRFIGIPIVFVLGTFKKRRGRPENIEKIALLKTAAIGDTTLLTAIIKDIEEFDDNIKITLFTGSSNYEFANLLTKQFKNLEVIRLPIKNPFKAIKIVRSKKFDIFLDFGPWPRLNAILSFFSNAKYTVGFKTKGQFRHFVYDEYVFHDDKIHELQNYKNILKTVEINKDNLPYISFIDNNKKDNNIVVIHMFPGGSRNYLKEWPKEYWVEVINYLTSRNKTVYLTGAKVDKNKAENIKKMCENKDKVIITAGKYSLEETIKLLARSWLVISVDTGIMHLASALKCNLIALHGPTSYKRWGPLNKNAISIQSSVECSPCLNLGFEYGCNENKCMQFIKPDVIINAINKFLDVEDEYNGVNKNEEVLRLGLS